MSREGLKSIPVEIIGDNDSRFGKRLEISGNLGIGGCMDVAVSGNRMYVTGSGKLHICDISVPRKPQILGCLSGLGNTRQLAAQDGMAYISARENGVFIVDAGKPAKPEILNHYNSIELATGIAVSGPVLFVACRNYGVELVDVSNPRKPLHLSTIRTGEAQSCVVRNGLLYAGVWQASELVICDVSNPRKPFVLSRTPLEGYGDGVFVRGNYCFAATGQNSRKMKERSVNDPGFGNGHGLEIFDVSNPEKPERVSHIKMPRLYRLFNDFWDVKVSGNYAFVADTYNGLFVVDISDIRNPRFAGYRQLPWNEQEKDPGAVAAIDIGEAVVYTAGCMSDLHVVEAPMAQPVTVDPDTPLKIPLPEKAVHDKFRIYKPDGQVWSVAFQGDTALTACGADGLHAVQLWPEIRKLEEYRTEGFAVDVKVHADYVYIAESKGGLSIWKTGRKSTLEPVGRFRAGEEAIKQVVIAPQGNYALLDVGKSSLFIIDITNPARPEKAFDTANLGLLYGYQIVEGLFENRYACCIWHGDGYYWYDLSGGTAPLFSGDHYDGARVAFNGIALLPGGREGLLTDSEGKYTLINRKETRPFDKLPQYGIKDHDLSGKPSIYDNTLYIANRFLGNVSFVDISDVKNPELLASFALDGNPGIILEHDGYPVIPCGYQGLLIYKEKLRK